MENIKKEIISIKKELSSCSNNTLYEKVLESHITKISNSIISKSDLWGNTKTDSKILLLCKRFNDILKRKALVEESAPEERTEKMSDIVEQMHIKTISYAKEILLALLSKFDLEIEIENTLPEENQKQTEPEEKIEVKANYVFRKVEKSFALHIIVVASIVIFFIIFKLYLN